MYASFIVKNVIRAWAIFCFHVHDVTNYVFGKGLVLRKMHVNLQKLWNYIAYAILVFLVL